METLLPPVEETYFPVIKRSTYSGSNKIIEPELLTYINKKIKLLGKATLFPRLPDHVAPLLYCNLTLVPCKKSFSIPLLQNTKNSIDGKVQIVNPPNMKTLYGSFHDLVCALVFVEYSAECWWFEQQQKNGRGEPFPERTRKDLRILFIANLMEVFLRAPTVGPSQSIPDYQKLFEDDETLAVQEKLQTLLTLEHFALTDLVHYGGTYGGEEWIQGHTERHLYRDMSTVQELQSLVNVATHIAHQLKSKKDNNLAKRKTKEQEKMERDQLPEEDDEEEVEESAGRVGPSKPEVEIVRKSPRKRKEQPKITSLPVITSPKRARKQP